MGGAIGTRHHPSAILKNIDKPTSSSAFALVQLFLGGTVGNSEILICSHALDLAGRK
jgi:hypothetical protein